MLSSLFSRLKSNRRMLSSVPVNFEPLESRQLLSASNYVSGSYFNESSWHLIGQEYQGTIAIDDSGIVSGIVTLDNGETIGINQSSGTYTYTTTTASITISTNAGSGGKGIATLSVGSGANAWAFELNGRLSSTEDYVTGGDDGGQSQATMIRQADDAFLNNSSSELIGNWSLTGEEMSGSVGISYNTKLNKLVVSSASLKVDGKALSINAAKSDVTLDTATGLVTLTLKNSAGVTQRTYVGYITDAGDFIAFKNSSNDDGNDMLVALKVGAKSSYSSADLAESSLWSLSSQEYNGRFVIDVTDQGTITISGTSLRMYVGEDISGSDKTVTGVNATGTLTIDKNGKVTMKLTFNPGSLMANTITLTGQMNSTKNTIALLTADGTTFMLLTTNADHAETLSNSGKTVNVGTVTGGQGVALSYTDLSEKYGGLSDIDGADELTGEISVKVASGTLVYTSGGITYEKTSSDGYFTLDSTATDIKYYTAVGASTSKFVLGLYVATTNSATDNTAAKLMFKRAANEVTPSVSKNNATQPSTNGGTDYTYGEFKLTRTSTSGAPTVTFTLSGTGVVDTDYIVQDADGNTLTASGGVYSIDFASASKYAYVRIIPKYIDPAVKATGVRTVTLTVQTPDFDSGYEAGRTTAATLNIKGKSDKTDTRISVSGVSKSTITEDTTSNQTIFTISRSSTANGTVTLNYSLTGIDGRYEPLEYSTDGVNWTDLNADPISFGETDLKVFIRLTMSGSPSVTLPTATAVFSVSILSNTDKFYTDALSATKSVVVKDAAIA